MAKVLRSAGFRDNDRLQQAAVSHAYHVQKGDQGPHVGRIQAFLLLSGIFQKTDDFLVPEDRAGYEDGFQKEFLDDYFGEWTEVTVWMYKDDRQIIDRSRQSFADAIVGVMTIRRMDAEQVKMDAEAPPLEARQQAAAFAPPKYKSLVVAGPRILAQRLG